MVIQFGGKAVMGLGNLPGHLIVLGLVGFQLGLHILAREMWRDSKNGLSQGWVGTHYEVPSSIVSLRKLWHSSPRSIAWAFFGSNLPTISVCHSKCGTTVSHFFYFIQIVDAFATQNFWPPCAEVACAHHVIQARPNVKQSRISADSYTLSACF